MFLSKHDFCSWHWPPVRCTAATPTGYSVTFTVLASPPACPS